MSDRLTHFFASRWGIIAAGAAIGLLAALLQKAGNPSNMGICVACFERDIAGGLGLHRAHPVQYIRPEIIGFVLGSFIAALVFREFKARAGSAPVTRFVLGMFAMIGALAFLGCPWRALLRLAGGDLNAVVGLAGLAAGIAGGVKFLKLGFNNGRSSLTYPAVGWIMPVMMAGLLLLLILEPKFTADGVVFFQRQLEGKDVPIFFSAAGPGSLAAPLLFSLGAGLVVGFLAQRTRFCTMGALRDVILMRDTHLLSGVGSLVAVAFFINLILAQFNPGFAGQPVAHSSHVWNFLGMALAGLAFTLAGGCPGRQLFLAGEGDGDAAVFVLGMVAGAGVAHNLTLAARPDPNLETVGGLLGAGQIAVILGLVVCVVFGFVLREKL